MKTKFHWIVCMALLLSMAFTAAGVPAAAQTCDPAFVTQTGTVLTVKPTSVNDTANLQCAFDLAVAAGPGMTVRLLKGTYHIGMIFVNNFDGAFIGAGAANTVVTNLPDLYVTPADMIFAPPSPENVWPDLISFMDSNFVLANMAIRITGDQPTQPWTIFNMDPPFRVLSAAVLVMGGEANARIEGVLVEGVPLPESMFGYNLINGIVFTPYYGSPYLLTGSLTIKDSSFKYISAAASFEAPYETPILITRNTFEDVMWAMDAEDPYNIHYEFSQNKVNALFGLDIYDAFWPWPEDVGSKYLIKNNEFTGTNGIFVEQQFGAGVSCLLMGNNVQNVTGISIYLGPGTNGCTVIGGSNKTNVVDLGTENVLVGVNNMGSGVGPVIHPFARMWK